MSNQLFAINNPFMKAVLLSSLNDMHFMLDSNISELKPYDFMAGMPQMIELYQKMKDCCEAMTCALKDTSAPEETNLLTHVNKLPESFTFPEFRYACAYTVEPDNMINKNWRLLDGITFEHYEDHHRLFTQVTIPGVGTTKFHSVIQMVKVEPEQ